MLIATEYLGNVGVGITSPQFFRGNDGQVYIVKLQNNRLGSKVLVNELLAAHLGKIMGLTFPRCEMITIPGKLLQKVQCLTTSEINLEQHIASLYLDSTEYLDTHNISQAINIPQMAGIMLFDHMFHNPDRTTNKKNLLIRQEDMGYKIYAIDHSHLFKSGKWTLESLNQLGTRIKIYCRYSFGMLLKDYLSPQDFIPYLEKAASISKEEIEGIVAKCPTEWLPDHYERQGLVHHIQIRCTMAEKITDTLCQYIPKSRGGGRWL